jgi:toxin ParE1/3/4
VRDWKVVVHPAAAEELQEASRWYAKRSNFAAQALIHEIDQAIARILHNPEGQPEFIAKTKRYILRQFPYSVVYRISSIEIQIIAFAHASRKPGYWKSR